MSEQTYRTCQNCGEINLNKDYCNRCGELININLKRRLERERQTAKLYAPSSQKGQNRITTWFEEAKDHTNPFIKVTARFFYSIWVLVLAIGGVLAMIVGYIAA